MGMAKKVSKSFLSDRGTRYCLKTQIDNMWIHFFSRLGYLIPYVVNFKNEIKNLPKWVLKKLRTNQHWFKDGSWFMTFADENGVRDNHGLPVNFYHNSEIDGTLEDCKRMNAFNNSLIFSYLGEFGTKMSSNYFSFSFLVQHNFINKK